MKLPRISIITPSLNQGEFIRETVESVLGQKYPDLDYWVIDGGSSDGTVSILASYGARLRWISEPDAGQADAVNKGFSRATGDVIGWLNSDDTYLPNALKCVGEYFSEHPQIECLYGDAHYIGRDGEILSQYPTKDFQWETFAQECYVCQPSVFFRRRALEAIGMLDTDFQVSMDYEFWMRLFRYSAPVRVRQCLAASRMYSENKSLSRRLLVHEEVFRAVRRHYGRIPYKWIFGYASYLHHRNDQYFDPRPTELSVVIRALLLMIWHNRANPRYLWRWLWKDEGGL